MHPEGFGLHLPVMHTSAPGGVGEQAAAAAAEAVTAASEMQALQPAVAAAAAAAGWLPQPVQVGCQAGRTLTARLSGMSGLHKSRCVPPGSASRRSL
jgi:hypothetical protein